MMGPGLSDPFTHITEKGRVLSQPRRKNFFFFLTSIPSSVLCDILRIMRHSGALSPRGSPFYPAGRTGTPLAVFMGGQNPTHTKGKRGPPIKVIAINGSPHSEGNTFQLLRTSADVLAQHGIETEIVQVGHLTLAGCQSCGGCAARHDGRCALPDDGLNAILAKMDRPTAFCWVLPSTMPGSAAP